MKTFRTRPRWLLPPLSLYFRRRRRPLRAASRTIGGATIGPPPAATPRVAPMTLVSVQQHFHPLRHMTWLRSSTSAVTWRLAPAAVAPARVADRIVVRRLIDARPFDGPESRPAALHFVSRQADVAPSRMAASRRSVPAVSAARAPQPANGTTWTDRRLTMRSVERETRMMRTRQVITERAHIEPAELRRADPRRSDGGADPVRLDWRRSTMASREGMAPTAVPIARPTALSAALPSTPAAVATSGERPTPTPPAAPAFAVDAAIVDRLTDTVMHRIERRVRIERERRGL